MKTSKKHAALGVGAVIATVLALTGVATAGNNVVEPASCVRGDTSTVCTVPHEQVTSTVTETATVTETVTATPSQTATTSATVDPTTDPQSDVKIVGMSAPASLWTQRIGEVGRCGVEARRIFADLTSTGRDQENLIRQAVADGMMPVISYKVPNPSTMASGGYASWIAATRTFLNSLGVQVTASYWHEPNGDMPAATFRDGSTQFLAIKSPTIAVGPILNGWLLDNQVSTFASFTSPSLLAAWDFVAVDSYQSGSEASPGSKLPARAIPLLENWLDGQGFPDKPIGLGEYNGFTAAAISAAGEAILSTDEVWFGLAWNSQGGSYAPLTGDRLEAYKATKADSRALHEEGC